MDLKFGGQPIPNASKKFKVKFNEFSFRFWMNVEFRVYS